MMARGAVERLPGLNGWLVFLFLALAVTAPSGSGYSYGPALLLIIALTCLLPVIRRIEGLDRADLLIIGAMVVFFAAHALEIMVDGQAVRAYDRPLRFLLAIPVLFLLIAWPPRPAFMWWGAIVGASLAGVITVVQKFLFGFDHASAWMMRIQFAALTLVLTMACFASLGYFHSRRESWGMLAGTTGGLLGLVAVLLSGVRGAWLVIPVILLVVALGWRRLFPARTTVTIIAAMAALVVVLVAVPQTGVKDRVGKAVGEVRAYIDSGTVESPSGARLEMWRTALLLIPDRPWLGWGRNGYVEEISRRVAAGESPEYLLHFNHAHNEILEAQLKRGVPGTIALLMIYLVPLVLFSRRAIAAADPVVRSVALAGLSLPLVFIFSGLTQAVFNHNSGATFYAFMLATTWAQMRTVERDARRLTS